MEFLMQQFSEDKQLESPPGALHRRRFPIRRATALKARILWPAKPQLFRRNCFQENRAGYAQSRAGGVDWIP